MISFIGGLFAALLALLGLSAAIGTVMAVVLPILLVVLLPVLLVVALLRRLRVVQSRLGSVVGVVVGLILMLGVFALLARPHWLTGQRSLLEVCHSEDGQSLTIDRNQGDFHFSCHMDSQKPTPPAESADQTDI